MILQRHHRAATAGDQIPPQQTDFGDSAGRAVARSLAYAPSFLSRRADPPP
jgi:hypothetical protein